MQHERAPRPSIPQHQLALHKLGYNLSRQHTLFPNPTPLAFSAFPPLHTYHASPDVTPHSSMLENPFQDFSRLSESIATDSALSPLHVSSLSSLHPFKIPLFSTPLHYPMPHHGYFPTNIFYPPVVPTDSAAAAEQFSKYYRLCISVHNLSLFATFLVDIDAKN